MTITLLAPDGVAVTAQQERQAKAAQHGGGSGRQLGGRSGFRVGTPTTVLTATSTTWTLGPCAAMIDPGATTHQGVYGWASDANVAGSVTAADDTNPRKDIVYIRVDDSTAGDGSGAVTADVHYLAGTPAFTPTAPALPARSFLVGTISVPVAGGGSPTVVLNPARFAAAGGVLPVGSVEDRATITAPYVGMEIQRTDLTQISGSGVRERWNGATWDHFGHAEWATVSSGLASGTAYNLGAHTAVPGKTTDTGFVAIVANGGVQARDAGLYRVEVAQKLSGSVGSARAFLSIEDSAVLSLNVPYGRAPFGNGEDSTSLAVEVALTAGQVVYPKIFQAAGTLNVSGFLRVTRTA